MMKERHEELYRQYMLLIAAWRVWARGLSREITIEEIERYDHDRWMIERDLRDLGWGVDENDKLVRFGD